MSSACSQVLGLPEIVAAIMGQLRFKQSLLAALQVNRLWEDVATRILWRVDPPIHGLIRISSVERRQYYANKISSLQIYDESKLDRLLNTRFPRLTKLFTFFPREGDQQYLYLFLQPTLQSFGYTGFKLRFESLMQIATRCPNLRFLTLRWLLDPVATRDLVRFLDLMPSLTHISLGPAGNVDQYLHLASRPNLHGLSISDATLTEDATMRILATVTSPYPALRYFKLPAHGKAFHCLARHLCSLSFLDLTLVDTSDDVLFPISDCTNLTTIFVMFRIDSYVAAEGLLAVARNSPHLRVFSLNSASKVDGGSITDDIIGQVATYLPTMICFRLGIKTNLTITALLYLGDRCTKLKGCYLRGDFDLEQLCRPNSAPPFPQLKDLELRKVSENVPYDRAMSTLQQTCPQLRLIAGSSPEDWDRSICVIHPRFYSEMDDFWD